MPTYELRIRRSAWDRYCNLAGIRTRQALAHELGVATSTITRLLNGNRPVGNAIVAGALGAFEARGVDRQQAFADLFDVITLDTDQAAA